MGNAADNSVEKVMSLFMALKYESKVRSLMFSYFDLWLFDL